MTENNICKNCKCNHEVIAPALGNCPCGCDIYETENSLSQQESEIIEELSNLEHEQWMYWTKAVIGKLEKQYEECKSDEERNGCDLALKLLQRNWTKNWIPYSELSEEVKEHDRKWARKILPFIQEVLAKGKEIGQTHTYKDTIISQKESKIAELEKENNHLKNLVTKIDAPKLADELCIMKHDVDQWKNSRYGIEFLGERGFNAKLFAIDLEKIIVRLRGEK